LETDSTVYIYGTDALPDIRITRVCIVIELTEKNDDVSHITARVCTASHSLGYERLLTKGKSSYQQQ